MQAAEWYGPGDLRLEAREDPVPGPGEIVVRVRAAGVCATDVRIFAFGHKRIPAGTPRILGHEIAGEVEALGQGVEGLHRGDRVAVAPNFGCGRCEQCTAGWTNLCPDHEAIGISLDGGFAERVRVPARAVVQGNVVRLPDRLSDGEAALVEPVSCCLAAQEGISLGPGDLALVIGAGPLGMMHVLLARMRGADRVMVSGFPDERLALARQCGADETFDPRRQDLGAAVLRATGGRGVDAVLVAAPSNRAAEEAMSVAAKRGRISFFAGQAGSDSRIQIDANAIHYRQLVLTGTSGSNVRQFRTALELVAEGRLDVRPLITDRLPLASVRAALERTQTHREMRLILDPTA